MLPASVSVRVPDGNSKIALLCALAAARLPVKAARDHQMKDNEEVVLQHEHDALPHPADVEDALVDKRTERRLDGAEEKRRSEPDLGHGLANQVPLQRFDVDGDVG